MTCHGRLVRVERDFTNGLRKHSQWRRKPGRKSYLDYKMSVFHCSRCTQKTLTRMTLTNGLGSEKEMSWCESGACRTVGRHGEDERRGGEMRECVKDRSSLETRTLFNFMSPGPRSLRTRYHAISLSNRGEPLSSQTNVRLTTNFKLESISDMPRSCTNFTYENSWMRLASMPQISRRAPSADRDYGNTTIRNTTFPTWRAHRLSQLQARGRAA